MKKTFLILGLIFIISLLSAEPLYVIWKMNDWSGGGGQLNMFDSTKFYIADGIKAATPMELDYFRDYVWTKMNTFPLTGAQTTNDLIGINDTLFAATGLVGKVYYSTNYGSSWIEYDTLPVNQSQMEVLSINYINGIMYASGYYGAVNRGFVYRSFDYKTWDTTTVQPEFVVDRVYDIVNMSGDIFIGVAGNPGGTTNFDGIIMRSTDACSTWSQFDTVGFAVCPAIEKLNDSTAIVAKDGYLDGAVLSVTYDAGLTWATIPNSLGWEIVTALYYDMGNNMLYVGDWSGKLASVDLSTNNWTALDTLGIIDTLSLITQITYIDTIMYILTQTPGCLYKSYDNGYTVELIDTIVSNTLFKLEQIGAHTYALATSDSIDGGRIYYSSYYPNGYLISSVIRLDSVFLPRTIINGNPDTIVDPILQYYALYGYKTFGINFSIKFRTFNNADMSDTVDWGSIAAITSFIKGNISDISSIDPNAKYIQYRVDMSTTRIELSPRLDSIMLMDSTDYSIVIKPENTLNRGITIDRIIGNTMYVINNTNNIEDFKIYNIMGRNIIDYKLKPGINKVMLNLKTGKYFIKSKDYNNSFILLK